MFILQEYKTGGQEKKCCWACVPCKENAYLVNVSECRPCPEGKRPNENKTGKVKINFLKMLLNLFINEVD